MNTGQKNTPEEKARSKAKDKASLKKRAKAYYQRHRISITIWGLILLFFFVLFLPRIVVFVEAGEAAVLFKRFHNGTVTDRTYGEGVHLIYPWDHMAIYNVRYQNFKENFEVLSNNGLLITVDMEMRYRPVYAILPILHQEVGPNYADKIVVPKVKAVVREIFGQYLPEEIYGSEKFIIENTVQNAIAEVSDRFVELDDVMIKNISLPPIVKTAIEEKLRQEQQAIEYDFRLIKEEKEAERKRIEAGGIRDFQNMITGGLTEQYLRFRGIEATLALAGSANSKVVVIGSGPSGLPIILDGTTGGGGGSALTAELAGGDSNGQLSNPGTLYPDSTMNSTLSMWQRLTGSGGSGSDEQTSRDSRMDAPEGEPLFQDSRSDSISAPSDTSFRDSRSDLQ